MKTFIASLLLLCTAVAPVPAKTICTNTWNVGTYVALTTSSPVSLTFLNPGVDPSTHDCVEGDPDCATLPCYMTGCIDLPYNTRNCLLYLVSQCGTQAPLIRQVTFLSAGACP